MNKKAMILSLAVLFLIAFVSSVSANFQIDSLPSRAVSLASLDNQTFVLASLTGAEASYMVYYINGTSIVSKKTIMGSLGFNSRIKTSAINSSSFMVSWYNGGTNRTWFYQIFDRDGTNSSSLQIGNLIGTATDFVDLSLSIDTNKWWLASTDDLNNDLDLDNSTLSSLGKGSSTIIDTTNTQTQANAQLVSIGSLSSDRLGIIYFDDPDNDATFRIINKTSKLSLFTTDVDNNVGTTAQVELAIMNDRAGMIYYDQNDLGIYFSVYDSNNNVITAPILIDSNAGTSSRVGITNVKLFNSTDEVFVLAWNDRNSDSIEAQVRYSNGTLIANYTLATNENTTSLNFDIFGKDDYLSLSGCDGQYLFVYSNTTGKTTLENKYINGSDTNGYCGFPDFVNPNGTLLQPVNDLYTNLTSQNFTINATDNVGLSNITLYIYNGTALVTTQTQTVSGTGGIFGTVFNFLFNDIFTWFYKVVDTAGNIFQTENRTIIVDTVYPQLAITYPDNLGNYNYIVSNITHVVNETNLANCTFTNGNFTEIITCNAPHYFNATENINLWYITATDLVGQSYVKPATFLVDTINPQINFSFGTPANNSITNNVNLLLNVTINETNFYSIRYIVANSTDIKHDLTFFTPITTVLFTNHSDEVYTFNVTVTDIVGHNASTETRTYTVDTLPPSLIINSPIATNYTNNTLLINITSDGSQVFFTDGGLTEYLGETYESYPEGYFNFSAFAQDEAGNQNITYVYFFVDSLPPSITYTSPTEANNSIKAVNTVRVKVNVIEASLQNITIRLYNSTKNEIASATNNTSPYFVEFTNLSNGIYYFNATACDMFSVCTDAQTRKVIIDQTLAGSLVLSLILNQYPYVDVNVTYPIKVSLQIANTPVDDANTTMILTNLNGTNITIPLIYNSSSNYYESLLIFDEIGNFPFTIKANSSAYGFKQESGTFLVRSPFYLTVKLFDQKTLDPIENDFSYITVEYTGRQLNPYLEPFIYPIADNRIIAKSFHAPYINGQANLKLYEPQTDYVFRWFDGRVTFDGEYAKANITDSYGTNVFLGEQQVQGLNETYQFVLSSFDQRPYVWAFNWIMIIALILAFVCAVAVFFWMPQYPMISLMVGIVFPIIIVAIRILAWWFFE